MDKNELDEDTFRINKNLVSPFLNTIRIIIKGKYFLQNEKMCYKFYWIEEIPPKKKKEKRNKL